MSDGTEQNQTVTVDVVTDSGTIGSFAGLAIPPNSTTGDFTYVSGNLIAMIAGETIRIYAGAPRTVIYTSFSKYPTKFTYYWDKLTGVMVEASAVSESMTATVKATETNIWQSQPTLTGDLDADGKVDMQDLTIARDAFGSYPGQPRWNPMADTNKDNKVNIIDFAIIAKNFGKAL